MGFGHSVPDSRFVGILRAIEAKAAMMIRKDTIALQNRTTLVAGMVAMVVTSVAGFANAGDADPVTTSVVVAAPPDPWSGTYVGGNLGYAFGGDDSVGHRDASGNLVSSPGLLKPGGGNFGLRLGWRNAGGAGSTAYGFELSVDGGGIEDEFSAQGYSGSVRLNSAVSLRFKPGRISSSGEMLYYGIVGVTRGNFDYALAGGSQGDTIQLNSEFDSTGYVLGLGLERQLEGNWSVFSELEYTQFGSEVLYDANRASTKATPKYTNLKVGVNFSF